MNKLATLFITLSFCLPLNAQPTPLNIAHPNQKNSTKGKEEVRVVNERILNSVYHDYCPIYFNGGLLFTSDRVESGSSKDADANFYFSSINPDGSYSSPVIYESKLNSTFQEGMATISPDGNTVIFSRDIRKVKQANGFSDVRLYTAKMIDGKWTKVKKMSINTKEFSSGHPTFSPDGKKLYFISNRPGGFGGTDIYVSKLRNNKWSKPKNLGPKVNSPRNELFPFIDVAGRIYFSSNRRAGLGLLDIYSSTMNDKEEWSKAINIGEPYNSPKNDFGYYSTDNGVSGFLSSNRTGGKGGNDIYVWGMKPQVSTVNMMTSAVKIIESKSKKVIGGATVTLLGREDDAKEWVTDQDGVIKISIEENFSGVFEINHPSYIKTQFEFNPENRNNLIVDVEKIKCVQLTGQLTNDAGKEIAMNDVTVFISNRTSQIEEKVTTNKNGVFEACLECNHDYSIKTISDRFYLDETNISTKNMECNGGAGISKKIRLLKVIQGDGAKENPNMNSLAEVTPPAMPKKEIVQEKIVKNIKPKLEKPTVNQPAAKISSTKKPTFDKSKLEAISIPEKPELAVELKKEKVELEKKNKKTGNAPRIITEASIKKEKAENSIFMIPNIYFDFDSYKIDVNDHHHLNDLGSYLKKNPSKKVAIKSFTDPIGSEAYNKWLSKRRAEEVVAFLMKTGVMQAQIQVNAVGEQPEVTNSNPADTKEVYSKSRRTEFEIIEDLGNASEAKPSVSESAKTEKIYVSSIYYGFDAYNLNNISQAEVDKLVRELTANPKLEVEIRSHTDSRGSSPYNQMLSQKRADEVARIIAAKGISRNRLTAKGFGESNLVNECKDGVPCSKDQHKENRRTEFVFKN